jgi:hypothetical protein
LLLTQLTFVSRDFAAPTIIGAVSTAVFYYMYNYIDKEEYRLSKHDSHVEEHIKAAHGEKTQ